MRCRIAVRWIARRSLGRTPGAGDRAALVRHLAICSACARAAREEERLTSDLLRLRTEAPFEIDVADQVMARLAEVRPEVRRNRATGWLLAGAAASAGAIVWSAIAHASSLTVVVGSLVRGAGAVAVDLLHPTAPVVGAFARIGIGACEALAPILEQGRRAFPSFQTALVAAVLVMALTTVYGIRRDLRTAGKEIE